MDIPLPGRAILQSQQYWLPYHHIPRIVDGNFTQTYTLWWGYRYLATLEYIQHKIKKFPYRSHLDFGCGDGRLLKFLYSADATPPLRLLGVDLDERAITYAKLLATENITYQCGNVFDVYEKFDLITAVEVFEHIPPELLPGVIDHLVSLLNKNGKLIFTVPSNNISVNKKHYQHFCLKLITALFHKFYIENIDFININNSYLLKLHAKLFTNKYFVLNYKPLLNYLYNFYKKYFLPAKEHNCQTIYCEILQTDCR